MPQVRAGTIKAYAVTAKKRLPSAPDIPTVDEAGVPGLLHLGLVRPVGAEGHAEGDHRQAQCRGGGGDGRSGRPQRMADSASKFRRATSRRPEALGALQKAEIEKWWPIIKAAQYQGRMSFAAAPSA